MRFNAYIYVCHAPNLPSALPHICIIIANFPISANKSREPKWRIVLRLGMAFCFAMCTINDRLVSGCALLMNKQRPTSYEHLLPSSLQIIIGSERQRLLLCLVHLLVLLRNCIKLLSTMLKISPAMIMNLDNLWKTLATHKDKGMRR